MHILEITVFVFFPLVFLSACESGNVRVCECDEKVFLSC